MRVLFTAQVGAGHWRPLAPLARALRDAGHDVAFAVTPFSCAEIGAFGFQTFPIGSDDWRKPAPTAPPAAVGHPPAADAVLRDVFLPGARHRLPDLLALVRSWRPDLLVREHTEYAAPIVAELLQLPHAAVQVSAYRGPIVDPQALAALDRLYDQYGVQRPAQAHPHLLLLPCPPRYVDPAAALPPTARFVQHVDFDRDDRAAGDQFDPALLAPDRPTVYATLGTAYNHTPGVLSAIIGGLRAEPINLIVTVNLNQDPADFGPQPPHVQIRRYLPQSAILPHCDLVVTHGGSGTVRSAIRHGLPTVVVPIAADQPENARRCAALGIGVVIAPECRHPETIGTAAREILHDPAYRRSATALQQELLALPGPEEAVNWLCRLATTSAPRESGDSARGRDSV